VKVQIWWLPLGVEDKKNSFGATFDLLIIGPLCSIARLAAGLLSHQYSLTYIYFRFSAKVKREINSGKWFPA